MPKSVEIHMPGAAGNRGDFTIDGERVGGITGFTLTSPENFTSCPTLTLDLGVYPVDYFGEANVYVKDTVRETLIKFGWTPPADEAVAE